MEFREAIIDGMILLLVHCLKENKHLNLGRPLLLFQYCVVARHRS